MRASTVHKNIEQNVEFKFMLDEMELFFNI